MSSERPPAATSPRGSECKGSTGSNGNPLELRESFVATPEPVGCCHFGGSIRVTRKVELLKSTTWCALGRQARMAAPVNLGLAHPLPERLGADVELAGDPRHLTMTLAGGLHRREHQGDRPLTHLGRVSLGRRVVVAMAPSCPRSGASTNPRAIH